MEPGFRTLDLSGRVVLITGGGGGIGQATARLAAARGAKVVVADMNVAGCEAVVKEITAGGGEAAFVRTDITKEADVAAMVDFTVRKFGGLHGAFNNAGVDTGHHHVIELELEEWSRNIAINLTGVFLSLKYEVRHMLEHGGGSIVNTSSAAGAVGFPNAPAYTAAKHGVVGLTKASALDYAAKKVRINAVLPGAIDTPMLRNAVHDETLRGIVERGHPLKGIGDAEDIAETVAWLLSDAASYMTGASIAVDGGYTVA